MMLTRHCKAFIAFHIGLAIWPFMTVPVLFAESFNSRPSQAELEATVTFGIACARGVNERCYATQTSTNQTYSVSPPDFAGTNGGWYLNNNLVSNLDLKATNLVPCYVDDNTVYDGSPNIVMLTVTGLWAQLEIGDRTNQFTGTPAIGTNPPTYGDYPWRIYAQDLEERYKVLNALKWTDRTLSSTNQQYIDVGSLADSTDIAGYNECVADFLAASWADGFGNVGPYGIGAHTDNYAFWPWNMSRGRGKVVLDRVTTNITVSSYQIYLQLYDWHRDYGDICHYIDDDGMGTNEHIKLLVSLSGNTTLPYVSDIIGDKSTPLTLGPYFPNIFMRSWRVNRPFVISKWQFNYCTVEY